MVAVYVVAKGRVEGEHHLVVVAAFLVIERFSAGGLILPVHVVHTVPVDLSVGLGSRPEVHQVVVLVQQVRVLRQVVRVVLLGIPHVEDAARHILVVVGSRVVSVAAPAQCRGAVHGVLEAGRCGELLRVVHFPVPRQDGRRFEVVHHACVALLPVLVTPVRVIVVRVGQPVSLFCRGPLLCALRGRAEGDQRERVAVVEAFFG